MLFGLAAFADAASFDTEILDKKPNPINDFVMETDFGGMFR